MRNKETTFLYKWFEEVWNKGRREAIDELALDMVTAHGLKPDGATKGVEEFKVFFDEMKNLLENVKVDVKDVISQDDMESAFCSVTARHIASGKDVKFSGITFCKIENGKIAEAWNQFDFLKMYQQIGYTLTPPKGFEEI